MAGRNQVPGSHSRVPSRAVSPTRRALILGAELLIAIVGGVIWLAVAWPLGEMLVKAGLGWFVITSSMLVAADGHRRRTSSRG